MVKKIAMTGTSRAQYDIKNRQLVNRRDKFKQAQNADTRKSV